ISIATADLNVKAPVVATVRQATTETVRTNVPPDSIPQTSESTGELYPATKAKLTGARLEQNHAVLAVRDASMSWTIEAGLGGVHDLQVRYANAGATPVLAELKV